VYVKLCFVIVFNVIWKPVYTDEFEGKVCPYAIIEIIIFGMRLFVLKYEDTYIL